MINVLCAYPYMKKNYIKTLNQNDKNIRFLLDSGAFTAFNNGSHIELNEYCAFVKNPPVKIWKYFTLDVIGNPEKTKKNYYTMLDKGLTPIPIFTRGANPSILEEYYKTSKIVGIGGLVGTKNNKAFVNGIMKLIKKRKVHLLGFTNPNYIKYYKPYMCDSSSWLTAPRFATITIYLGNGYRIKLEKKKIYTLSKFKQNKIQEMGINYKDLLHEQNWRGGKSVSRDLSCAGEVLYSLECSKYLNVNYFLVTGTSNDLIQIIKWHHYHKEKFQ